MGRRSTRHRSASDWRWDGKGASPDARGARSFVMVGLTGLIQLSDRNRAPTGCVSPSVIIERNGIFAGLRRVTLPAPTAALRRSPGQIRLCSLPSSRGDSGQA